MDDCALIMVFSIGGILYYLFLHGYGHALRVIVVDLRMVVNFEHYGLRYFIWTVF